MIILFICSKQSQSVKGFVEGDDGLFATKALITVDDYKKLGFTVKIHEVAHPSKAHFCGMTCSEDGTVLKDCRRVFQTFGWTSSFISAGHRVMDELLRAKALSLCYELPQCPILGELAREALRLTHGIDARFVDSYNPIPLDYSGPTGPFQPTMSARSLYEEQYGVSISTQLLVEAAIRDHDMMEVSRLIPPPTHVLDYSSRYIEVG